MEIKAPDQEDITLIEAALYSSLAGIGGVLAYMVRTLNKGDRPVWYRALLEMFSSGFVGLLAMLLCKALNLDWQWSGVVVGVFGWLGAETSIALLSNFIRDKVGLGIKDEQERKKTGKKSD